MRLLPGRRVNNKSPSGRGSQNRQRRKGDKQSRHSRAGTDNAMPGPVLKQSHHSSTRLVRSDSTGTFTPKFINALNVKDSRPTDVARDLAEFSGKRWVWLKDDKFGFVKGWVTEDNGATLQVRCDNEGSDRTVDSQAVDKVNPPKFNLADDMADLTYLNEASVIHNLRQRYETDLIYVCLDKAG
jgi:myosin protein heavy chain